MTLESSKRREQYATNGTTGPFSVGFYFLTESDLSVIYTDDDGVEVALAVTADYTVTGAGNPSGGTITTTAAYPSGGTITILRAIDPLQETDYTETDAFPAESHERALDKLTMLVQQLMEVTDRALVFSPSDELGSTLPPAAARASKLLGFDSLGRISLNVPADQSAASLALLLASSAHQSEGAGMIGFDPALTYPPGTVGARLQEYVNLTDFGAVGDGITDDTAAVQDAITIGAGRVVDGIGLTYKITAPLIKIASGTVFRNAHLDFSSMPAQPGDDNCIYVAGTFGTPVPLAADLAVDAVTVQVGDTTGFAAEQWGYLASNAVWSTVDGTTYGQFVRVKSVDSPTQMTLYSGPIIAFLTADTATISALTPVERVRFEEIRITGAQANNQTGIRYFGAVDCSDSGCVFVDIDYAAVIFHRSVNCRGNGTVKRARAAGLSYGYVISYGSLGCSVIGGYGEDVRHYVTVGGQSGINLFWKANYNVVMNSRSAGIDSHVASYGGECIGNQITLANGFGAEGITMQGLNWVVNDNHVYGVTGTAILGQPLVTNGFGNRGTIRGNRIHFCASVPGTTIGIYVQVETTSGSNWDAADVDGNHFYGGAGSVSLFHIYLNANRASSTIKDVTIRANVSSSAATSEAIFVRTLGASSLVDNVIIDSNIVRTTGLRAVRLLADAASSQVAEVVLACNVIKGGSSENVRIDGGLGSVATVVESDNVYSGSATKFSLGNAITGLRIRSLRDEPPLTTTGASASISVGTDSHIANRAGTVTYTLPSASVFPGRILHFRTLQAQTIVSASANVVPIDGGAAGTAIVPATAGAWADVSSDGTNWNIVAKG